MKAYTVQHVSRMQCTSLISIPPTHYPIYTGDKKFIYVSMQSSIVPVHAIELPPELGAWPRNCCWAERDPEVIARLD